MNQRNVNIVTIKGQVIEINGHTVEFHSYEDAEAFLLELALKGFFDFNR